MVDSKENYKFDLGVKGLRPFWQKESRVWYHNILCARLSTLGLHRTSLHLPCFDSELTSSKMLKNIRLLIFLVNHWSSSVKSTNLHRNTYGAISYIGSEGASLSLWTGSLEQGELGGAWSVCASSTVVSKIGISRIWPSGVDMPQFLQILF